MARVSFDEETHGRGPADATVETQLVEGAKLAGLQDRLRHFPRSFAKSS